MALSADLPEVQYEETRARRARYADLSVRAARSGDPIVALHAMAAADVASLQMVLWERVLIATFRPAAAYAEHAQAISDHLGEPYDPADGSGGGAALVNRMRDRIGRDLDERTRRHLDTVYASTDHLLGLALPDRSHLAGFARERLQDTDPDTYAYTRLRTATARMAAAREAGRLGHPQTAAAEAWAAAWEALDAYLVEAAHRCGDEHLVGAHLRWVLLCQEAATLTTAPGTVDGARTRVESLVGKVLGAVEGNRFSRDFLPE